MSAIKYNDQKPKVCHTVTRGQDHYCSRCDTTWSMDDTKPECLTHGQHSTKVLSDLRKMLND